MTTRAAWKVQIVAGAGALSVVLASAPQAVQATSPGLPGPEQFAGVWRLSAVSDASGSCRLVLELKPDNRSPGVGWRLRADQQCLRRLSLPHLSTWRPETSGVVLAADHLRVALIFAPQSDGRYVARARSGRIAYILAPEPPRRRTSGRSAAEPTARTSGT